MKKLKCKSIKVDSLDADKGIERLNSFIKTQKLLKSQIINIDTERKDGDIFYDMWYWNDQE